MLNEEEGAESVDLERGKGVGVRDSSRRFLRM